MHKKRTEIVQIIEKLRRVSHAVHAQSKKAEITTGLTGTQLLTVKTIAESGPIKVTDLAARIHLHPATVVGILDRLETRGLTIRVRSQQDRRVVRVDLTETGREIVLHSPEFTEVLLADGLEKLTHKQLLSIAANLEQLATILTDHSRPTQHMNLSKAENTQKKKAKTRISSPLLQGDKCFSEA